MTTDFAEWDQVGTDLMVCPHCGTQTLRLVACSCCGEVRRRLDRFVQSSSNREQVFASLNRQVGFLEQADLVEQQRLAQRHLEHVERQLGRCLDVRRRHLGLDRWPSTRELELLLVRTRMVHHCSWGPIANLAVVVVYPKCRSGVVFQFDEECFLVRLTRDSDWVLRPAVLPVAALDGPDAWTSLDRQAGDALDLGLALRIASVDCPLDCLRSHGVAEAWRQAAYLLLLSLLKQAGS